MISLRNAGLRGRTRTEWLDSRHTFSFGGFRDPEHPGFRALRVINEDVIAPGGGFPTHPHRDMEILTWVLEGAVAHEDSTGSHHVLRPGEIQKMSAGTGIRHSEFNASRQEPVHLLQVWILPDRVGLDPAYHQRSTPVHEEPGRLHAIAGPEGRGNVVPLHQDATLWIGRLFEGDRVDLPLEQDRHGWLQVARGEVSLAKEALGPGDGAALSREESPALVAASEAEILFFDLG